MTSEIVEFKCPSCGQKLTEEEYWHVCQIQKSQIEQIVENEIALRTVQIVRSLKEKNDRERDEAISRIVNEEKLRLQKLFDEKEKQLEIAHAENARAEDEKISQAILQTETKHRQEKKEFELKYSRIECTYKELVDKFEKLEKAWNNIPAELRGTAGELVLQDELQKEFITDKFTLKKVGHEVADVVQTIVTETGNVLATPIAYDKKMGNIVTKLDIEKAKRYKTIHGTDHVLIVTAKGIRTNRFTEKREGILLVHPIVLIDVVRMIRSLIIETEKCAMNSEALKIAEARLYNYVTSPQYNREQEIILDIKSQLDELQTSEDVRQNRSSEKRRKLLARLYEIIDKNKSIIGGIVQGDEKVGKQHPSDFGYDV